MSRPLKFRGLDDYGVWRQGNLIQCQNGDRVIVPFAAAQKFGTHCQAAAKVKPETVGQFTGLTDKHGQEIYEGDVLRFEDVGTVYPPDYTNVEVVWDEGTACFCVEFIEILDGNREEMWKYNENAVITGNKYEHSELLGATND